MKIIHYKRPKHCLFQREKHKDNLSGILHECPQTSYNILSPTTYLHLKWAKFSLVGNFPVQWRATWAASWQSTLYHSECQIYIILSLLYDNAWPITVQCAQYRHVCYTSPFVRAIVWCDFIDELPNPSVKMRIYRITPENTRPNE